MFSEIKEFIRASMGKNKEEVAKLNRRYDLEQTALGDLTFMDRINKPKGMLEVDYRNQKIREARQELSEISTNKN